MLKNLNHNQPRILKVICKSENQKRFMFLIKIGDEQYAIAIGFLYPSLINVHKAVAVPSFDLIL